MQLHKLGVYVGCPRCEWPGHLSYQRELRPGERPEPGDLYRCGHCGMNVHHLQGAEACGLEWIDRGPPVVDRQGCNRRVTVERLAELVGRTAPLSADPSGPPHHLTTELIALSARVAATSLGAPPREKEIADALSLAALTLQLLQYRLRRPPGAW